MTRNQMKNRMAVIAIEVAFMMAGCQSNAGNSVETEALKEQIAHLEQQVSDLEQLLASGKMLVRTEDEQGQTGIITDDSVESKVDASTEDSMQSAVDNNQQLQNDVSVGNNFVSGHNESIYHNSLHSATIGDISEQQGASANMGTTYTMEDLNRVVEEFVTKVNTIVPSEAVSENMEQFFAFKQEEKQIDDMLDQYEDELEYLYKRQSLTRDAYKKLERELDLLDDKLGAAEDQLEFVFGIDD
ncbi:MAG: hypothetical protein K1W16_14645 [Lachnospiraceae bacterium]